MWLPFLLYSGQLIGKTFFFQLSPFAPEKGVSRDGLGHLVPRQPTHSEFIVSKQPESGASSRTPLIPPAFRDIDYDDNDDNNDDNDVP